MFSKNMHQKTKTFLYMIHICCQRERGL